MCDIRLVDAGALAGTAGAGVCVVPVFFSRPPNSVVAPLPIVCSTTFHTKNKTFCQDINHYPSLIRIAIAVP